VYVPCKSGRFEDRVNFNVLISCILYPVCNIVGADVDGQRSEVYNLFENAPNEGFIGLNEAPVRKIGDQRIGCLFADTRVDVFNAAIISEMSQILTCLGDTSLVSVAAISLDTERLGLEQNGAGSAARIAAGFLFISYDCLVVIAVYLASPADDIIVTHYYQNRYLNRF